jgi:hypothetical protein
MIGAGFIAMLLTTGAVATILEMLNAWPSLFDWKLNLGSLTIQGFYCFLIGMALAWMLWAVIFYLYFRDADQHTAVARMTRALIAGTILELLISIPTYVKSVQTPSDCYCEKGSYTGLVFGCTAVFWLFGPGVYLLLLREKRRWTPKV